MFQLKGQHQNSIMCFSTGGFIFGKNKKHFLPLRNVEQAF
jgi:hypothetical protein